MTGLGGVNITTNDLEFLAQIIEYDPWGKISREEGVGDSVRRSHYSARR